MAYASFRSENGSNSGMRTNCETMAYGSCRSEICSLGCSAGKEDPAELDESDLRDDIGLVA